MSSEQTLTDKNPAQKEFSKLLDNDFKDRKLVENRIVKAKVIEILKAYIIVDCRGKSEAMIPISEFKEEEIAKLKVGDSINCFVERIESMKTGEIVLSYEKAKSLAAWEKCITAYENKEVLNGQIKNKIKGGYVLQLFSGAISAFLPTSQLDTRPLKGAAVESLMNTPIKVMIVRLDRSRGNCAVSRRAVLEISKNAQIIEALKNIKEGDVVESTVKSIVEWGIFLDINGVDALLHISDLGHGRVKKTSDFVKIGEKLTVKISKIDPKTNRISASCKALKNDPFLNIEDRFKVGGVYQGTVTKIVDYGCFVRIEDGIEGLIHNSELDWTNRNVKPSKILSVSQSIKFRIVNIDKDLKRISLSYKALLENPWDKLKDKIGKEVKIKINNISEKAVFGQLTESGLNGMLPYKEISWNENIEDLKKFKKNDVISVKIISINDDKIRFSKRALEKDPLDWFKDNKKKVGSVISTKVVEVLKSGVKVAVDPEKKLIVMIKKNQLAIELADCRPEIYNVGNTMADALIEELDYVNRKVVLSPKEAQKKEQDSLIKKFGEGAAKSGATLKNIFESAIGSKKKKKKEK